MSLFSSSKLGSGTRTGGGATAAPAGVTGGLASGITSGRLPTRQLGLRKTAKITDEEFEKLADFIYNKTGISISIKRKYLLENRLGARLSELGLKTFKEYYDYLQLDKNRAAEMEVICEKVTTNETSFYRDARQLGIFQNEILKETLAKQEALGRKELFIWSAGCSSGEEPYTLAIMLHEALGMSIIGWNIRITANDLSPAMLRLARAGVYTDYALRTTPKGIIAKYFDKVDAGYQVKPRVQKLVQFGPVNLSDPASTRRVPRSHIVFCRNVIIYFDDAMKKKAITAFYDNLLPGGHLFLGHSESIHKLSTAFRPVPKPGAICYKKEE
ncbi:CheR family methyltransferase [Oleidesulfovibrio alaskensis]|jgi:chemotaxis protein methyltransferase CheR|uniref:CheR family methyltransferase n=1 Tax=Oleidesulfovibrio alaskensis TaxID=58180 RepID=UPI0003F8A775|nr:CheR family methyltransferase [Oleidesulfovibrio alaskensis]